MTFPPRTIAEFNRRLDESRLQLANAPQLQFMQPVPEPPPAPGTLAALEADLRARAARDLRPEARQAIDRAWEGLSADVLAKHGRRLPLETHDVENAQQEAALRAARVAGEQYIQLAAIAPHRKASLEPALSRFCELAADFVNVVTANWLSAADHAVAERRRNDWSW